MELRLVESVDTDLDENQDDYSIKLSDGFREYLSLEDEDNFIVIKADGSQQAPRLGENIVYVSEPEGNFLNSERKFFLLPYLSTHVEVPLVGRLKDGELAVVLTWTAGKKVNGDRMIIEELDLKTEFQPSETVLCDVGFSMRQCNGVKLTSDQIVDGNRFATVQAIKFDRLGDFNYMVYTKRSMRNVTANPQLDRDMELLATL